MISKCHYKVDGVATEGTGNAAHTLGKNVDMTMRQRLPDSGEVLIQITKYLGVTKSPFNNICVQQGCKIVIIFPSSLSRLSAVVTLHIALQMLPCCSWNPG